MDMNRLSGLRGYASALPTPFEGPFIDEEVFASFCEWQIGQDIAALVVNGTTGEAPTLTPVEQRRLIRVAVQTARGRVPVIAGAGSNSTVHAIELADQAAAAGADALLVVTPYYNKPSQEGLYSHFRAVHDASELPVILYDVPSRTGCALALDTIARLAELPRILGLKDATGDLSRPANVRRIAGNRLLLLSGDDATALDFIGLGGDGCISVVSNVAPTLCSRLFALASTAPAEARLIERRLAPLTRALFLEGNPVPVKWALGLMGRMNPTLRLPLVEPGDTTRAAVRSALAELGLLGRNMFVRRAAPALACRA